MTDDASTRASTIDVTPTQIETAARSLRQRPPRETVFDIEDLDGRLRQVDGGPRGQHRDLPAMITAIIGPSGCGKSTFIRCLNRMNDLSRAPASRARSSTTASTSTAPDVDAVGVRRRIGMVFQRPNPFPKSIYDNVACGPRVLGMKGGLDERVEKALRARGALGRGQGPAEAERPGRSPAASSSASASRGHRDRARGAAPGRAGLGARPDRDARRSRS